MKLFSMKLLSFISRFALQVRNFWLLRITHYYFCAKLYKICLQSFMASLKFMIKLFTSFRVNNIMCSTIVLCYLYPSSTVILGQCCDGVDQKSAQYRPNVQFCTMSQHRAGIGVLPFRHQPSVCGISCRYRLEGTSAGYSPDVAHASALYRLDIAYVPALYWLSRQYWLAH